jgi:hypothetical protein
MEYVVPFQERKQLKDTLYPLHFWERNIIVVTYEIRVFFEGPQKEVFSSI